VVGCQVDQWRPSGTAKHKGRAMNDHSQAPRPIETPYPLSGEGQAEELAAQTSELAGCKVRLQGRPGEETLENGSTATRPSQEPPSAEKDVEQEVVVRMPPLRQESVRVRIREIARAELRLVYDPLPEE
jgi:hypothetical protein